MAVEGFHPPVHAFVAHPHDMARKALTDELIAAGLTPAGEASDAATAGEAIRATAPDIALLAADLGDTTGAALCAALRRDLPVCRVLIISERDDDRAWEAMQAGAYGCWLAHEPQIPLADAVRGLMRRESLPTAGWARHLLAAYDEIATTTRRVPAPTLRNEERHVLEELAQGKTPSEVAAAEELTTHLVRVRAGYAIIKLYRGVADELAVAQPAGVSAGTAF